MQISDADGLYEQLQNAGNSIIVVTDGGRWAASSREKSVNDLIAIIIRYFQPCPKLYVNHAWITEIRTLLTNSRTEQPSYDFKQGFLNLSGNGNFDYDCLEHVVQTCVAINNISKDSTGYILVGISETEATASRINELYNVNPIEFNGFYINGIDHEASAFSKDLDSYFLFIKQKIQDMNFTEALKQQILRDIELCSYNGFHILKLKVKSTKSICHFDEKYYIRQGSSTENITSAEEVTALFTSYLS